MPLPAGFRGRPYSHDRHGRSARLRDDLGRSRIHRAQDRGRARERAGDSRRHRQVLRRGGEGKHGTGGTGRAGPGGPRATARHGERGPGDPPRERDDRPGGRTALERHPYRTVREGVSRAVPRGRRALQPGASAARAKGRHHLAREAHGQAQYRRAPAAAGRAHQDQGAGPGGGPPRFDAADALRRERGHAPAGPLRGRFLRLAEPRLRRIHARPHGALHVAAARHPAGHRPDRAAANRPRSIRR